MARFLSAEWFRELGAASARAAGGAGSRPGDDRAEAAGTGAGGPVDRGAGPALVIQISVTGAPEGELRYQVVVEGTQTRVLPPGAVFWPAQVQMSSDYATMAGIAEGKLPAIEALSLGRARVSGDTSALSTDGPSLAGLDLVPPAVRARTTF